MRPSRALRKAAASVAVSLVALSTAAFAPAPEQPADPVNPTDEMTTPVIPDELDLQSVATAPDRAQPAEPPATECVTATSGDTLNRLATAAGITLDELLLNNPKYVPNPDRLIADVDQVCFAPGNVPAPQAAVETVAGVRFEAIFISISIFTAIHLTHPHARACVCRSTSSSCFSTVARSTHCCIGDIALSLRSTPCSRWGSR